MVSNLLVNVSWFDLNECTKIGTMAEFNTHFNSLLILPIRIEREFGRDQRTRYYGAKPDISMNIVALMV